MLFRSEEATKQMKAIKKGIFRIIPRSLLKLYSWRELEIKICGKPSFNVDALKKITKYENCTEKDPYIQFFWKALEEFTDEERSLYLKFVWGRSRMPSYMEEINHLIKIMDCSNPDQTLPEAHTWYAFYNLSFFQLTLPAYTSLEKAKEKILYAIRYCKSIDTDENIEVAWEE